MEAQINLLDVTDGAEEPAASRLLLTVMGVGFLGLLALFNALFSWQALPALENIDGFIGAITSGGSGIWFYLIALLAGLAVVVGRLVSEVLSD